MGAGLWVSRRVRRSADFFVAGRDLPGGLVFVTLLAANIGAGSTVGATGLAYRYGLSAWWWSGSAALGCLGLGLLVAPRMHRLAGEHGFLTVGDFLEWRFDRSVRGIVSLILWFGTLAILAGQLIAMAWAFEVIAGVPKAWGCLAAGVVLLAYFAGGGLLAAAWVNLLELVVLLVGFLLAVPFAWNEAGAWPGLRGPDPAFGRMDGMGWAAILGLAVTFVPSFMVSPGLVQKTFAARTAASARWAVLANAAALAVFAFVPATLGMAVRALRPGLENAELALPVLTAEILPPWLGGLALAALFAAEISTADAVLFMLSTSLAKDLYKAFLHPDADDARLLRVGRLTTLVAGVLGVVLAIALPSVVDALRLFYAVMTVALFMPVVAGLLSKRAGAGAARGALAAAILVTLVSRLVRSGPEAAWLPYAAGLAAAAAVFALAEIRASTRAAGVALVGLLLLPALGCGSSGLTDRPPTRTPPPTGGYALVWSDEFEGPSGALVDATKWAFDMGGGGWGNQELETYTDRGRNASLTGDGSLAIQALRESFTGADGITREYTSARLKTQGKFEQAYGRFEARLKVPRGQGLWPAFWMLGADIPTVGWPGCGEIDVMENIGREPSMVHGTLHGPGYSGARGIGGAFTLPGGARFADDFHVFAVEWEPAAIRWSVDGTLYQTRTPADLPAGQRWAFDHPFFLILNVAVGGSWPGNPNSTTVFPQTMFVDYVRVYRRQP